MWRYVLFDLGDTLADNHPLSPAQMDRLVARGLVVWLRRRSMRAADEFSPDERAQLGEMTGARLVRAINEGLEQVRREYWSSNAEAPVEKVFARLQSELAAATGLVASTSELEEIYLQSRLPRQRAIPGALELLAELRSAGIRTGLVSNCVFSREPMDAYLRQQGLAELLDVVVYSADVGIRKPDPKPFLAALARLGARPAEAVFVGDSLAVDMAGAAAAGMAGIWFWGNCPKVGKLAAGAPLGPGTWPDLSSLPELAAIASRLAGKEATAASGAPQPAAAVRGEGAAARLVTIAGAARDYPELKSLLLSGLPAK